MRDDDGTERFVAVLLSTGLMLSELAADLIDALPEQAYPGEDPRDVVLEMIAGTIATALRDAHRCEVERAIELMELAADRTIEHLRLACELARAGNDGDGTL